MQSRNQLYFSSFSKSSIQLPVQNVKLYKYKILRKCFKIKTNILKPINQPNLSSSPIKKIKKTANKGTSSFNSISRTHFYSIIKKDESNTDFYDKNYTILDKHIRNIKLLRPINKKIKISEKIKDSISTEQSSGLIKNFSLTKMEKSIEQVKQTFEKSVKRKTNINHEGISTQLKYSPNISGLYCYSLKKEAIIEKIIDSY